MSTNETPNLAAALRQSLDEATREIEQRRELAALREELARTERVRIAEAASKMATTLTRPGMGNGTAHGEQVRVVRLDELLDLLGDDGDGEQT